MFDARSNTPILGFIRPKRVNSTLFAFRPVFIISLALLFLLNALGGDMLVSEVWAARSSSGLTSVGPDSTGSPAPLKALSASTFTLPRELGYIQESTEIPNSSKTVIHIQDAHCNYDAQKSISEILNYLTTEYGISVVNCEGAAEGYDLSPLTDIPEKDIRAKTADFFVREGILSAAEYYAVNNPQKVNLWGVEDSSLYLENLKVYRDSLTHKDEVDRYIKSIGHILDSLKRHIYSSELLEFDRQYTGYKDNKITFREYALYLMSMAQKRMIDIKSFSNMYLLSQTLSDEDKINFKRANNEKDEIVDKLKRSLSKNELEELTAMVGKLKSEKISQADFYTYLIKKAKSVKFDISGYTELQKYMIYISLYSAVDRTKVAKEMDALEYKIKTSLYENDAQRELGVLSKNLAIMRNMFNISLTRDDYIYYKEHMETFAVTNYIFFIDKKAPLYKINVVLDKNIGLLDEYRENMNRFYECSIERDRAFIRNIKFTDHDRPNSIIITGGFHTESLRELFKNENVSYVSIMPKFRNEKGYESPYMKRLAGQKTALENVINTAIPAILNLQPPEVLSPKIMRELEGVAGEEGLRVLSQAVAVLFRTGLDRVIVKIKYSGVPKKNGEEDKVAIFTNGGGEAIKGQIWPVSSLDASDAIAQGGYEMEFDIPSFEIKTISPKSQGVVARPSVSTTSNISAPSTGLRVINPVTFVGVLRDAGGKLIYSSEDLDFTPFSGGSAIRITPRAGGKEAVVYVADSGTSDETKKLIPKLKELRKEKYEPENIMKPVSEVNDRMRERGKISEFLARLQKPGMEIILLKNNADVKAFFMGNKFYATKDFIDDPLLIIRTPEAVTTEGAIAPVSGTMEAMPKIASTVTQASTAAEVSGEKMYEEAARPAIETDGLIRKITATRMLILVGSEEDRNAVASYNKIARDIMGVEAAIRINSYVAKDNWMPGFRELLKIELKNFVDSDMKKDAPLMSIRIKEGKDTRSDVDQMINDILVELGYKDNLKDIKSRIRLVQVQIGPDKRTNPAIDFFTDMGMLECDRYINGDYGDENRVPPQNLQDNFLTLLKLSIKNGADFDGKNINEILNMIFTGHLLEIKPADFKTFDEWNKANRQLMQSV